MMPRSALIGEISIDADGTWSYRGTEMIRRDIVCLFYQHLRRDASGAYFIGMGHQQYPVHVEDAAFVIRGLRWATGPDGSAECAYLLLSDDSVEKLDPCTLRIGKNNIPYCKVKLGAFEARFSRSSYQVLAERLQYDPGAGGYAISLNGQRYLLSE